MVPLETSFWEVITIPIDPFVDALRRDKQYYIALNWNGKEGMRGFDLAERNLSQVNLSKAYLYETILIRANLQEVNLQEANLTRRQKGDIPV